MPEIIFPCFVIMAFSAVGLAASALWMVALYGWSKWPDWSNCTIFRLLILEVIGRFPERVLKAI